MKAKFIYLSLACIMGLLSSCTPAAMNNESNAHTPTPLYGTGGEHSTEPDNEKD